ncbi:MAG: VIT domain-containing protein [Methanosarcinaceae archaeon]|nr:VIT domain-containing protein [Methanosarcinaceae archaeon]
MLTVVHIGSAAPTADYLNINTEVNNGYAVSTVEEKLTNPAATAVQGEFSFLIPEGAFISGFSLTIDGKEYRADVLPKEEATEKFEAAASAGRTAGLLETKENNLFSYALSFEPRQSITVKLTYEQALKKTLGEYELVQYLESPQAVNSLSATVNISSANPLIRLETPGFPDAEARYLSANEGQVSYKASRLPGPGQGSELRVVFETQNPPLNGNMLFYEKDGEGYMMHIFSPTEEDLGTTALGKDIIFVLDKSGSMRGDKLEQVKEAFEDIITSLPAQDRFNIIFFDSSIQSSSETLRETTPEAKSGALEFVNGLDSGGGTNINEALVTALGMFGPESERVPIIVFLTDGMPTDGVTSPYVIRENVKAANRAQVSIFSMAFGIEDENDYGFLRAMSLENYGTAEWFAPSFDSEEKIGNFYDTISTPLVTDLDFSYGGKVSEPVNNGGKNLFAGSDAVVLGKYTPGSGSISSVLSATTRDGIRTFSKEFTVAPSAENAFIPRLWAYSSIETLLDRIEVEGEAENLVAEVTELSLKFEFVTPYTSLFVEMPGLIGETEGGVPVEPVENIQGAMAADMVQSSPTRDTNAVPTDAFSTQDEAMAAPEAAPEQAYGEVVYEKEGIDGGAEIPERDNGEKATPGLGVFFSFAGLLSIAFLLSRKRY